MLNREPDRVEELLALYNTEIGRKKQETAADLQTKKYTILLYNALGGDGLGPPLGACTVQSALYLWY